MNDMTICTDDKMSPTEARNEKQIEVETQCFAGFRKYFQTLLLFHFEKAFLTVSGPYH